MSARLVRLVLLGTASLTVLFIVPAFAEPRDQDDVRQAVERREIRPLADILEVVRGRLPGDVVGVEIERKDGRWMYELRVLDARGRVFDVYVDARSGEIDRTEEK
jgi:uncharacterized membrane protein YkoI